MLAAAVVVAGTLVTYKQGAEIGRQSYEDDGQTLRSEIVVAGQRLSIALERAPRRAIVTAGGRTITHAVPPGTVALENGDWQAYAFAAEQYPEARLPVAVELLLPASGQTVDATLRVLTNPDKSRFVVVTTGALTVEVDVAPNGAVAHVAIPLQGIEVRPDAAPRPKTADVPRAPPPGVTEEPIEVLRGSVKLRGVLWRPAHVEGRPPLALLLAGSGPTDRDGNQVGLHTDSYRMLAEALAKAGVASIRFDKRGVGASDSVREADGTIGDLVDDAGALLAFARRDGRFSKLTLVGHSEGGLVALLLAQKAPPPDGLVLVAATGRPLWQVVHEQLARRADAPALAVADEILAALRDGNPVAHYPPEMVALFRPSVEKFWRSEIALDPPTLLGRLTLATTIVQGETDMQVSVEDARRLAAARKDARLALLPRVNHVLKQEAERGPHQPSYTDPSRPLGPGVADAVLAGVVR